MRWKLALAAIVFVSVGLVSARSASADATVVVQPGDNLYQIAQRHGSSVADIVRANGLPAADVVYVGQRLLVPSASGPLSPAARSLPGIASSSHTVRSGETLVQIALRYGTTVDAIARANGLQSPDHVFVGQELLVPSAAEGRAPAAALVGAPGSAATTGAAGRGIVVDLSDQTLTALQDGVPVRAFVVSTGKAVTPTPTGNFSIYSRYASQHMVGPGYDLPGVPHVQYFSGSYAIHGSYWLVGFGVPTSHGCVNMALPDAAWLWRWAGIGTPVTVRY